MANIAIFRINYKSDFILTLESDAGWMTPFCIKFWTGAPSQAYFAGYDGTTYTNCSPVEGEPSKLVVQFDDHHLPIGELKYQIGYHFTVDDFPTTVEDEVLNQASVIIVQDGEPAQVMLDLNGETAPEIEFALPAYANEQQRIENEEQRIENEQARVEAEEARVAAENARVDEFAQLKTESEEATANANAAAQLATEKAALAQQKADYAQTQGDYAKAQGDYAKSQGDIAQADHQRAESDHATATADHTQAASDHSTATADHTQAVSDHTQAAADHTQAGADHTRAESDHTRAESDHEAVEVYVDSLGAFDISAYHATGGVLAKYADLTAALGTGGANIPEAIRNGGMSVKFVQSSDNKYVQFRYMSDDATTAATFTNTANWQGVDEEPIDESHNLVESGGVKLFGKHLNNNVYIEKGKLIQRSSGVFSYVNSSTYDCIWIFIPKGASKVYLNNIQDNEPFYYFSSPIPSTDTYVNANSTGAVPSNAVICLRNLKKSLNVDGYDETYVTYDYKIDDTPTKDSAFSVTSGGTYNAIEAAKKESSRGYYIDYKHIYSIDGANSRYMEFNTHDAVLVPIDCTYKSVSVEGAIASRYIFFSSPELVYANQVDSNTTGIIPSEAKFCCINMKKSDNPNGYIKMLVRFTPSDCDCDTTPKSASTKPITSNAVYNGLKQSANNLFIDYGHVFSIEGQTVSYTTNSNFDCFWVKVTNTAAKITITGVSFTGNYQYFKEPTVSYEARLGSNSTGAIPEGTVLVLLNVPHASNYDNVVVKLDYKDTGKENVFGNLKVVVSKDSDGYKSFYVRHEIDDLHDGILTFAYIPVYGISQNNNHNNIEQRFYYVGNKSDTDGNIMVSANRVHDCHDSQSPMFTDNFGPMYGNHGYATLRAVVTNHGQTRGDIGSLWHDDDVSTRVFTIANIEGDYLYLLPVITDTGVEGYETASWKYGNSMPSKITNENETVTLDIASIDRFDYQVADVKNVRVIIDRESVDEGTYICNEVTLSFEQECYNPAKVNSWWNVPQDISEPITFEPDYAGLMLKFSRNYTINGSKGFLSLSVNTVINNLYPYPLHHYIDVVPMFPFQYGQYKPNIYIPKMSKHDGDIDFREEFISVDGSHARVPYYRNTNDIVDVDDMPDRAYCYLKTDGGDILFGCAGGHSLINGMSISSTRNNHIAPNDEVGAWYPGAGNKHYNNILLRTGETDNMLPDTFINEFEGYMCWYKPSDNIHCFYYKTKEGYIVYIHTNQTINKGSVTLPDFMNGLGVDRTVEKTDGITLKTNTVVDGKIFFNSDNSETTYNWIVFVLKCT